MSETYYHFISSLRQGLATAIDGVPSGKRAAIEVSLHAERRALGSGEWDDGVPLITRTVELYGPGDIATFDGRMIVRREPQPNSANFEPNYFPAVEFADPDYPWRFSPEPAAAGGSSKPANVVALTPWIALVVLVAEDRGDDIRREFEELPRGPKQRPAIRVSRQSNLPDLSRAWRWAHIQATAGVQDLIAEELATLTDEQRESLEPDDLRAMLAGEIEALAASQPELVVSRLVCPRRLRPKTLYRALIVPTYKLGWAAALDTPEAHTAASGSMATHPVWDAAVDDPIELPYFHDWEFRTSERGDFEFLVRLLEPRLLEGLGLREIDCARPGFGLTVEGSAVDEEEAGRLEMEGALQSLDTAYTPWGDDAPASTSPDPFRERLADEVLNLAAVQARASLPDGFGAGVIEDLSFLVGRDGKSVRFAWRTPAPTTGIFDYGPEDETGAWSYSNHALSDTPAVSHSVVVDMVPERTYHFRVRIDGGAAETADATIRIPLPAVVPPVYGRWHAARDSVGTDGSAWLDVLNLDPRHRAAAGLGAEVVRRQQEALMASAWDQIGAIEAGNDVLRRARMGRDGSVFLHGRLRDLGLEDLLRLTGPVQRRVVRTNGDGERRTVRAELAAGTRLPAAALAPAFRRISRPRGPLRRKQAVRRVDLLRRLLEDNLRAAGPHPMPEGTPRPCAITARTYQQFVFDVLQEGGDINLPDLPPIHIPDGGTTPGGGATPGSGVSSGGRVASGGAVAPLGGVAPISALSSSAGPRTTSAIGSGIRPLSVAAGSTGAASGSEPPQSPAMIPVPESAKRFCEDRIGCAQLRSVLRESARTVSATPLLSGGLARSSVRASATAGTRAPLSGATPTLSPAAVTVAGMGTRQPAGERALVDVVCEAFDGFLRPGSGDGTKPTRNAAYLQQLRDDLEVALDPRTTIPARTERRLRLPGPLAARFEEGADGDPLDEIMAHPEFPQPMYEPLRDLAEWHVLPGVEAVPQNTVGLLETNGRFVESYMVGLNHELAGELLWRRYPTDQRGSYFRQFWNVDEYVPEPSELGPDGALKPEVREALKDIAALHEWGGSELGENDNRKASGKGEMLVLVVRGDLLKRYPNALVYAVEAHLVAGDDDEPDRLMPRLAEFGDPSGEPVFPVFRGSLGADLVFLGFPFDEDAARSTADQNGDIDHPGMFFVFEERVGEARFGLDSVDASVPVQNEPIEIGGWEELHWGHFQLAEPEAAGGYLDASDSIIEADGELWNAGTDAALRARITFQRPARLAVHADQMMPPP